MKDYKSLSHTRWDCKYHIVFIPKKRKKVIYGSLRNYLVEIILNETTYKKLKTLVMKSNHPTRIDYITALIEKEHKSLSSNNQLPDN